MSKVGYSYWGFLGDVKFDSDGNEVSTPDGNAFYSWSIIKALQDEGYDVVSVMPDRDRIGYDKMGRDLFGSWLKDERADAYEALVKNSYKEITKEELYKQWDKTLKGSEYVILEWRFEIIGRNDDTTKMMYDMGDKDLKWQPDYFIQKNLLNYCNENGIKVVVFDLDYKLTTIDIIDYNIKYIIELGFKWFWSGISHLGTTPIHVHVPFDMDNIDVFDLERPTKNLVYVGNRYERDWCIDKYIPEDLEGVKVYGNWEENGRDSRERWPNIEFGGRVQTRDMRDVYKDYACTILLAKKEYCENDFVTARVLEALFYGSVPLFIEEFSDNVISTFCGMYNSLLVVKDKNDVKAKCEYFRSRPEEREKVVKYMQHRLKFMDAKYFVQLVSGIVRKGQGESND